MLLPGPQDRDHLLQAHYSGPTYSNLSTAAAITTGKGWRRDAGLGASPFRRKALVFGNESPFGAWR